MDYPVLNYLHELSFWELKKTAHSGPTDALSVVCGCVCVGLNLYSRSVCVVRVGP